jgi:hypothetical protein
MARITGRVEILVNGEMLLNKAGAVASGIGVSGEPNFELEMIQGDSGPHGYIEKPIMAQCEVTITDRSDVSLNDVMEGATCLRNLSLTAGEGEVTLIYQGPYWTEHVEE